MIGTVTGRIVFELAIRTNDLKQDLPPLEYHEITHDHTRSWCIFNGRVAIPTR